MQQLMSIFLSSLGGGASKMAQMATIKWESLLSSLVYSLLGIVIFAIAYVVIELLTPFSLREELVEKQNVAIGVLLGCTMLGIAIIIHGAVT